MITSETLTIRRLERILPLTYEGTLRIFNKAPITLWSLSTTGDLKARNNIEIKFLGQTCNIKAKLTKIP